ncbi:hypothetical protein LINPERHAP2_LOCUS19853 [Linum perenne]
MSRKLPQLWAKKGRIQVCDVGWGYYVVKFDTVGDYEHAMFGGPWMVGDHYVVIQDWRPYFQLEDSPITTLRVWVRLPGVPLGYFDVAILTIIGNRIGKTVRLDLTTLGGSRGNFARICVEVDLSKPLLSKYRLRRRVRRIEYEGLHTIFYSCGCFGHVQDTCQKKDVDEPVEALGEMIVNPIFQNKSFEDLRPEVEEDFGPWMKVSRAGRRGKRDAPMPSNLPPSPPQVVESSFGNQFNVLGNDDLPATNDDSVPFNEVVNVEGNKSVADSVDWNKENVESNIMTVGDDSAQRVIEPDFVPMDVESGPKAQEQPKASKESVRGEFVKSAKAGLSSSLGSEKRNVKKGVKVHVSNSKQASAGLSLGSGSGRSIKGTSTQLPLQQSRTGIGSSLPRLVVSSKGQESSPAVGGD